MKKILKKTLNIINKILKNKRIFYYTPNENNTFGKTAVKTKFGFWCVGNVLDETDIACGVLNFGQVEAEESELTLKIYDHIKAKDKPVVFDVGANTGYYSLMAANVFKREADIYAFEPVSEFSDCIREASKINGFEQSIRICDFALSKENGKSEIYISGTCSSLDKDFNKKELPSKTIELKKLDDFAAAINPDYIKIDTEGHELSVIEGGIETIKRAKPILFVEIIQNLAINGYFNKNYSKTIKLLRDSGYESYLFKGGKLSKTDENLEIEGVYMYLFVDPTKHADFVKNLEIHFQ